MPGRNKSTGKHCVTVKRDTLLWRLIVVPQTLTLLHQGHRGRTEFGALLTSDITDRQIPLCFSLSGRKEKSKKIRHHGTITKPLHSYVTTPSRLLPCRDSLRLFPLTLHSHVWQESAASRHMGNLIGLVLKRLGVPFSTRLYYMWVSVFRHLVREVIVSLWSSFCICNWTGRRCEFILGIP